jgi:hypothetical protein
MRKMDKLTEQINHYKPLVQQIVTSAESDYVFTDLDYHKQLVRNSEFAEANQNYVHEIIFRFHAAALITLRRNLSWVESIEDSLHNSKLFGFCASLRGFIESAADSFYSLRYAPQNLATYFNKVKRCIEREETESICLFKELEDWGLHFMEAGKYENKNLNEEHFKAKSTWEYIKAIDSEKTLKPVYPLYKKLCQITHPSRETTYLFFGQTDEYVWGVSGIDEKFEISNIVQLYDLEYEEIFQKSFNTAMILLWIIDLFSIPGLRCPLIRSIDFTAIPAFNKVKQTISSNHSFHWAAENTSSQ